MAANDGRAEWLAKVDQDIATLKSNNVRPLAIVRRLQDAKSGRYDDTEWRAFDQPGRGISQYYEERGIPTVVLEFRHRAHAKVTEAQLHALLEQFVAIESLAYHEFDPRDGAALYIMLKPCNSAKTGSKKA